MAALAAVAGLLDLVRSHRLCAMRAAWMCAIVNITAIILAFEFDPPRIGKRPVGY
jgi:hypothetical protein